jgi:hypothetical protein
LLTLAKDDSYRINLGDIDGLSSKGDTEYFIRIMDDRPPEVRILRPSADQPITPLEEVSIEARADDDYGIARFELVYSVAGRQERMTRFASVTGTNVAKLGRYLLAAEDLKVQPGDVITYYARAVDIGRGKRPRRARRWVPAAVRPRSSKASSRHRRRSSTQRGISSDAPAQGDRQKTSRPSRRRRRN